MCRDTKGRQAARILALLRTELAKALADPRLSSDTAELLQALQAHLDGRTSRKRPQRRK